MYSKLLKNFIGRNKNLFILILVSLTLSLSGYIFSDSLTKNFVVSIETDAQENLGGDFVVDIGNSEIQVFEDFYKDFPYKQDIELAKEYSILSAVEQNDTVISSNIVFHSSNYPFYYDLGNTVINHSGSLFLSKDLYNSLEVKQLAILGNDFKVQGYYTNQAGFTFSDFLGTESVFLDISNFEKTLSDDTNTLIDKKYYLKLKDQNNFDKIRNYFEENKEKYNNIRIRNYKNGGDRFADIISNLRSYINYAVLFSFLLTSTIIFIAISSFFINERKSISVLKILGLQNRILIIFIILSFIGVLILLLLIGIFINYFIFSFIQNINLTKGFILYKNSIIQALGIGGIIILGSTIFPLIKFVGKNTNAGLGEDFYGLFTKKEALISSILFSILGITLSLFLGYSLMKSSIAILAILIFGIIFYLVLLLIIKLLQKYTSGFRKKHFQIFDAIRVANKPGNMSFLISLSFFVIFSITFSLLILFGNFYNRLQVNLNTDKNFFVLNISPDTYDQLSPEYKQESFSLIKGRILKVNNKSLEQHFGKKPTREFTREYNITDNSLSDLEVIQGEKEVEQNTVSLDYDFSQNLQVGVGDEILFSIFGLEKKLTIINIRESRDRSINPFFYFQVNSEEFKEFPKQYFLSSYVDIEDIENTKKYFYDISSGTTTFIEVEKILEELKEISTKVLLVIQSLFLYIIIFCILSIVVVILFFSQQQKKSNYLYTLLGSNSIQNRIKNFSEYAILATLMILLSLLIISPLFYYLLSLNTFINFSWTVFYQSLGIICIIYFVLLGGLWFGNKR